MADHNAKITELEEYLKSIGEERKRITDHLTMLKQHVANPRAMKAYQQAADANLKLLDNYGRAASDERKRLYGEMQKANKPASTAAADKTQAAVDAQKPEMELAKSREEQAKQFNAATKDILGAGDKGYLDMLAAGKGVPNYTLGPDGRPLTTRPHSVTMLVPKDKNDLGDKQALQEEKDRILARKELDKSVAGVFFPGPSGKPPTADNVFGSGTITFKDDPNNPGQKVVDKNTTSFIYQGTPAEYARMQAEYEASKKLEKEASRFNAVNVPADTYEALNRRGSEALGVRLPNAVKDDMAARAMVAAPKPVLDIEAPALAMQKYGLTPEAPRLLPGQTRVPQIGIGDNYDGAPDTAMVPNAGPGALERMSRGVPAYVPEGLRSAPAYVEKPTDMDTFSDQRPAEIERAKAQTLRNIANSDLLANSAGAPLLRSSDVAQILPRSNDPRVGTNQYEELTGLARTPDQIRSWDPSMYTRLKTLAARADQPDSYWAGERADIAADTAKRLAMPGSRSAALNVVKNAGIGLGEMGDAYLQDIFDINTPVYYPPKIEHPEMAGPLGSYD